MSVLSQQNNKRIIKNTLLLYFRMAITMLVQLYTSRVVLNSLGVSDYGIYSIVGGIATIFNFLNGSMTNASQRYITIALSIGDKRKLQHIFCTTMNIHLIMAGVILVLAEVIGLWFLYTHMQISSGRLEAAFWVFQCSVLASMVAIISVPYTSAIIAHEKMSAFAYIGIVNVMLKLIIAYLLSIVAFDHLIFYATLILLVQVIICFLYMCYCKHNFAETRYCLVWDKELIKEMFSFAGWNLSGNLSVMCYSQGVDMLLNTFFGPVVNAARAISGQVQGAINQFVFNFQTALNPQIMKSFAQNNIDYLCSLINRGARFSYYLMFLLVIPVVIEAKLILAIWLKNVPDHTVLFLRITLFTGLIYTLSNPLITFNQATGKVKGFQIASSMTLVMILPISYICLKLGCPAWSVFIVHFFMEFTALFIRLYILHRITGFLIFKYIRQVLFIVLAVTLLSIPIPLLLYFMLSDTIVSALIVCVVSFFCAACSIFFVGMSSNERTFILKNISSMMSRMRNSKVINK